MSDPTCCHDPDYQVWRGRNVCMSCGIEESPATIETEKTEYETDEIEGVPF